MRQVVFFVLTFCHTIYVGRREVSRMNYLIEDDILEALDRLEYEVITVEELREKLFEIIEELRISNCTSSIAWNRVAQMREKYNV